MIRRPPKSTLTGPPFPYTTLFRPAPAGVEPAVSDGQPLLESKDELGIRSPVGVFAESSDGDRGARRREFRSAGLRVTGCTERDENAVEPHRRSTAALSRPEYRLGRSEERRVGNECVRTCLYRGMPDH